MQRAEPPVLKLPHKIPRADALREVKLPLVVYHHYCQAHGPDTVHIQVKARLRLVKSELQGLLGSKHKIQFTMQQDFFKGSHKKTAKLWTLSKLLKQPTPNRGGLDSKSLDFKRLS